LPVFRPPLCDLVWPRKNDSFVDLKKFCYCQPEHSVDIANDRLSPRYIGVGRKKNFYTPTHTHTRHPDWLSRASQHARGATKNCRICCVNTHIQSAKVWLKSKLRWLKYSIFSRGLFFIGAPCACGL